jgi:hypothetical protein
MMDILLDINKLSEHIITLLEQKRYIEYRKNIDSIFHLFQYALRKSNNPNESNLVNSISDKIISIGQSVLNKGFVQESIEIANRLMDASNINEQHPYTPNIFQFIVEIARSASKQNNEESIYGIMNFLDSIVEKGKYANDIIYYFSTFYIALNRNEILSMRSKDNVIHRFFHRIIDRLTYGKGTKRDLYRQVAYSLIKYFIIYQGSLNHFSYFLHRLYLQNKVNMDEDIYEIFIVVSIFLYYVSFRERYFNDEFKEKVKMLLSNKQRENISIESNFSLRNLILNSEGDFWKYYSEVKNELTKGDWEYVPEFEAKWLRLDEYIREFYIYYSYLFSNPFYFNSEYLEKLDSDELRLLSEYFDDKRLKQDYIEGLQTFLEWINKETKYENNNYIAEYIINAYKQSVFKELLATNKEVDKIEKNIQSIKEKVVNAIQNSVLTKLDYQIDPSLISFAQGKQFHFKMEIPTDYLADKVHYINFDIDKIIVGRLERYIIAALKSRFINLNLKFNDTEKIKKLLLAAESLNNIGVEVNTIIKNHNNQTIIAHFENEESREQLKNFEEKLLTIGNFTYLINALYIDRKKLKINIVNIDIEIRSAQENDIKEKLLETKINDNVYKVNVVNDIKLELTYDEAKKYFMQKYKILEIRVKLEFYTMGDKLGILVSYAT